MAGSNAPSEVSERQIDSLLATLQPLRGTQFDLLKIPGDVLKAFEPSQIGTIVGALMDACIPQLQVIVKEEDRKQLAAVGLKKHEGILKDREGYPDYIHETGLRAELKLLYVDPVGVQMKKPSTPREPSARLTQKVTVKNVKPERDVLLVVAYQLQPDKSDNALYVPTIIDLGVFSMIECIRKRDARLIECGGKWFGDYEVPGILSKAGRKKRAQGLPIDEKTYGRKKSEEKDYNEDTNFGKLARTPYAPLQAFITKHSGLLQAPDEEVESEIEEAAKAAQVVDRELQS